MPQLTGVSSTIGMSLDLLQLFTPNVVIISNPARLEIAGTFTYFVFTGTGLSIYRDGDFMTGFAAGTLDTLMFYPAFNSSVIARITELNLNIATDGAIFTDPVALMSYLNNVAWKMTATGGNDDYDLTSLDSFPTFGRNVINMLGGDDTVTGGYGVDIINGGTGNDLIYDSKGNDVARGGLGDDWIAAAGGSNGNDRFYGDIGNDALLGGVGKDKLYGGAGDDSLMGGVGNDLMNGGKGRDTQDGGAGSDVFVFTTSDGADLIVAFELAFDTLRIAAASVRITETDGDAVVRFGTTAVTLDGIAKADLVMGDHIILI